MSTQLGRGRKAAKVILTDATRADLERYARARTTSQGLAQRARMILLCAEGKKNREIADLFGVTEHTAGKWRKRFLARGIEGLCDSPRPNVHRKLGDEKVEEVIRTTLESPPPRLHPLEYPQDGGARRCQPFVGIQSLASVQAQAHRQDTFTLSTDEFFVEKVRDIVGLYMNPPDHAVILCVDEKTQVQALERMQPLLPLDFGRVVQRTHTYARHGTTNLFAALDYATGKVIAECFPRKRALEFRRFLSRTDAEVPSELEVHLVVDNSSIHGAPTIKRWLSGHPRFHLHFVPTYSSWLNLVERWFANLTEDALRRGNHRSTQELEEAIIAYVDATNQAAKPFVWTKTADQILASVTRFCQRLLSFAQF